MIIGYSTGAIEGHNINVLKAAELIKEAGCDAIELSALRWDELHTFTALPDDIVDFINGNFKYISVHLPKAVVLDCDEVFLINAVNILTNMFNNVNCIMHPDSIIRWDKWKDVSSLCIENMDSRSDYGRTDESLSLIFRSLLPKAGFCLDLAHAYASTWYPWDTGRVAFKERLRQSHVSGLLLGKHVRVSDPAFRRNGNWKPLAQQLGWLRLQRPNAPFILEGPVPANLIAIKTEVEEVRRMANQ